MTEIIDVCPAALWDRERPPIFCSLPVHEHGDHAAHRSHDTADVPPIQTWPHERDDLAAWQAREAYLGGLAQHTDVELVQLKAGVAVQKVQHGWLEGRAPAPAIAALDAVESDLTEAQSRRFLSGL